MANKLQPIMAHTALLTLAAEGIRAKILRLKEDVSKIEEGAMQTGKLDAVADHLAIYRERIQRNQDQLQAIKTMYLYETGTELGILRELA